MVVFAPIDKLSSLYTDLTSQIKHSVDTIKNKSEFESETKESKISENKSYAIGNYAFTYLEPATSYNIHIVSAQISDADNVKKERTPEQQIEEKTKNSSPDAEVEVEGISFYEELQNHVYIDAKQVSLLYQKNNHGGYSDMPLFLEGNRFTTHNQAYATQAYNFTFNINKEPEPHIEYMYKYDKSVDYRV